jgi:hypothetical protein
MARSRITTVTYSMPIYWASYLINGDASGIDDDDIAQADAAIADIGLGSPVDVGDSEFRHRGDYGRLAGDYADYTFLDHGKGTREARAPRIVRDFNTLGDLVEHAARDLGATHTSGSDAHTKIYFPRGGQHPYEEATVWRKSGYWHAQGPGARTGVARLPAGAKPIAGHARRAAEPQFKLGAPRPGTTVRDYEAVDNRGRRIAGPSKSYSDMKRAAGTAGVVKFVRPGASEAKRGGRSKSTPEEHAYAAGEKYGQDQIRSDHFLDWVYDQLVEASKMPPDQVNPLETKADALEISRKMFQQLVWDAQREGAAQEALGSDATREEIHAFYEGFRGACDTSREWLADELLTKKRELEGNRASEARRRPKAKRSARKKRR